MESDASAEMSQRARFALGTEVVILQHPSFATGAHGVVCADHDQSSATVDITLLGSEAVVTVTTSQIKPQINLVEGQSYTQVLRALNARYVRESL